jgi:hypothetical protein
MAAVNFGRGAVDGFNNSMYGPTQTQYAIGDGTGSQNVNNSPSLLSQLFHPANTLGSWLGGLGSDVAQSLGYNGSTIQADPNAILNGAYGVPNGSDPTLSDVKAQLAGLNAGGVTPTFDNTQMGYSGQPLQDLGGADLYTGMGANPYFGNPFNNDNGGQGTGPSANDVARWQAYNSLGNQFLD